MHRREHLNVRPGLQPEVIGQPPRRERDDLGQDRRRVVARDEVQVALHAGRRRARRVLPGVDRVGGADDQRARGLAEDLGQRGHRDATGRQQIAEHPPRADGRQLVGVAHEQDVGALADRGEERPGQPHVEHRRLVDDEEVGVDRVGRPARRALARHPFEQAVDGRRLGARALGEPPCRLAGRRAQPHAHAMRAQHVDERPHDRGLAGPRTAGEDRQPVLDRALDGRPLRVGRHERPPHRTAQRAHLQRRRALEQRAHPLGQPRLGPVQRRPADQLGLDDDLAARGQLVDGVIGVRAQQPRRATGELGAR